MNFAMARGGHTGHSIVKTISSKEVVMKSIIALVCALGFGLSTLAIAAPGDSQQAKPAVDCKKTPTHPDCKAKK